VVYTHELTFVGPLLVKRYTSWARGEPRREWSVLQRVHGHVEDLTPRPVAADLDADPPTVTMTVLPGEPLDENPTPAQIDALAAAMATLWAVPHHNIPSVDVWRDDLDFARRLTTARRPARGVAAAAYDAAASWWHGPDPALLHTEPTMTVLGHRDPNLANYLWDGQKVRIVDFEDAAISDPATELALLVEHLSARQLDADGFCSRFDVDVIRLRAARRLWATFWLWLLLPGGPSHWRNPPGTADAQAERLLRLFDDT